MKQNIIKQNKRKFHLDVIMDYLKKTWKSEHHCKCKKQSDWFEITYLHKNFNKFLGTHVKLIYKELLKNVEIPALI